MIEDKCLLFSKKYGYMTFINLCAGSKIEKCAEFLSFSLCVCVHTSVRGCHKGAHIHNALLGLVYTVGLHSSIFPRNVFFLFLRAVICNTVLFSALGCSNISESMQFQGIHGKTFPTL